MVGREDPDPGKVGLSHGARREGVGLCERDSGGRVFRGLDEGI